MEQYFVEKEVDRVFVQLQRERLEERNVIGSDFFVAEVKFVQNDIIDVIIGQEVIYASDEVHGDVHGNDMFAYTKKSRCGCFRREY